MGLKKQIIQFKDGKEIATYNSATEAANAIESTKSNISKCCLGKLKQVNGFTFKYSGEFTNQQKNDGEFKCPYCEKRFDSYNGLTKHIFRYKEHGNDITQEKLLADFKYNGVRPKCKCGCGEYTDISYVNGAHFTTFIKGHSMRIHNNWGHNEQAKLHSTETRKKQYLFGERDQWNKGKSWKDTYSEEEIKRLTKIHRDKIYRMLTETEFSLSSKKETEFIEHCVKPLGVEYDTQYYLKDLHHFCDVFIPSKNSIIEFQGDYWHGNPVKYSDEELSEYQRKKVNKDKELREYCNKNGINLIEVWESDYDKDYSGVKALLEEQLNKK